MKKLKIRVQSRTERYPLTGTVTRGSEVNHAKLSSPRRPYQKRDPLTYAPIPHKSAVVMLRASPAEKAAWEAAAREWSGSLSDWLRLAAAEYLEVCASRAELRALARSKPPAKKRTGRRVA
jgi:hypothetical protein